MFSHPRWRILCVVAIVLGCAQGAFAKDPPPEQEGFVVSRDDEAGTVTILVPARGGRIHWSDVLLGLTESAELNGEAIASLMPSGSFRATSSKAWFTLFGINAATRGKASLRMTRLNVDDDDAPRHALKIVVKQSVFRDAKARLRDRLSGSDGTDSTRWGLEINDEDLRKPHRGPLVILVHGFNSRPEKLNVLQSRLRAGGDPADDDSKDPDETRRVVWTFRYPNDGPIRKSGELLAAELTKLRKAHPDTEVALVAHSMGGLVARVALEDPELDPGNVRQLIMVATPNQGSHLAFLPGGFDVLEHLANERSPGAGRFASSLTDGLNEARSDLRPDSKFLRELNARPRNPRVRYSLLLGDGAPLSAAAVAELTKLLERAREKSRTVKLFSPRIDPIINDPAEFTHGEGDGVVAVQRGRLKGVEDTVVLPFSHNAVTGKFRSAGDKKLLRAIVERLHPSGE